MNNTRSLETHGAVIPVDQGKAQHPVERHSLDEVRGQPQPQGCRIGVISMALGAEFLRQNEPGIEMARSYCRRHGYEYLLYDDEKSFPFEIKKHPAWYKLLLLERHLKDYDWLFWLDTDTLIMEPARRLETWLDPEHDAVCSHCRPEWTIVNTGVWFVRNTPWSHQFLREAFDAPSKGGWWEQWAVGSLLKAAPAKLARVRVEEQLAGILRLGARGPRSYWYRDGYHWILHFAGRNKNGQDIRPLFNYYQRFIRKEE